MMRQINSISLLAIFLLAGCTFINKSKDNSQTNELQGINQQSPLPPLAIKIREKARELRLKEDNPRALKTLVGSEGGKLPQYVKEILLNEVKNQPWTPLPPANRPCYVDPKRIQPKDIFYALQRAAFGTTRPTSSDIPDPDQGVKLSPYWSGIKWSHFLGYELESFRLLDQLEEWFSELNPDSFNDMTPQSLGLGVVSIPEEARVFVRRQLVKNDLDLVFDNRGRDRTEIRCFLAHQVTSIQANIGIHQLYRLMAGFNHFENITDIDFGLIHEAADFDVINRILTEKPKISGFRLDIKWLGSAANRSLSINPSENSTVKGVK